MKKKKEEKKRKYEISRDEYLDRNAINKNAEKYRKRYGDEFVDTLIKCSNNIYSKLIEHSMSLGTMSSITGVSKSALQSYAMGDRMPKVETLIKIAKTFGITVDYLLGNSECSNIVDNDIYDKLGLSEKAIGSLCKHKEKHKENANPENEEQSIQYDLETQFFATINLLLEINNGNIIEDIGFYLHGTSRIKESPIPTTIKTPFGRKSKVELSEPHEYQLFNVLDSLFSLRNKLKNHALLPLGFAGYKASDEFDKWKKEQL